MRRRIWTWSRGSQGGRPPAFDKEAYTRRNVVERCFNRLKQQALDGEEFGRELVESGDVL
jgi:transposase